MICMHIYIHIYGFPGGSDGKKKSACNAGDLGSISGSGIFPGEEYALRQKKIHFSILA